MGICLSEREQKILIYSAQGLVEQEVASLLCVSCSRLKKLKIDLTKKLKVKNITQAIRRATAYGLLLQGAEQKL